MDGHSAEHDLNHAAYMEYNSVRSAREPVIQTAFGGRQVS